MSALRLMACLALAAAAALLGCRRSVPEPAPTAAQPLPAIEVLKDGRWLFTHVEPDVRFATTDKPDAVPGPARAVVRVIDPTKPAGKRLDTTEVYVVNVNDLLKSGKAEARTMPREVFESAAIAQLGPGQHSLRSARPASTPAPPAPGGDTKDDAGVPAAGARGTAAVTLYGTSWCGACRSARQYLGERRIPFADKDIEADPAAARELAEKAARHGIIADRVPVLDVRGRLLVGFDPARVQALLGDQI